MHSSSSAPQHPTLTTHELAFIDEILLKYGDDDNNILGCSELDGFLTALVSGPIIPAAEWQAAIWGDADTQPTWDSAQEAQRFISLITQQLQHTAATLQTDPQQFHALFSLVESGGQTMPVVEDWCFGYLRAVNLREDAWAGLPDSTAKQLSLLYLFGSEDMFDELNALSHDKIALLQQSIEPVARALYTHWQSRPATGTITPETPV